jgi:glutamyl-Q tRNA(Asp) synthetase
MRIVTRFAPSPTGRLHLGHAFSALLAHDFARRRGGAFLLRIEDIDPGRSRSEHVDSIIDDLAWLGVEWDGEIIFQSERLDLYQDALDRLRAAGLAYPCFCTRATIAAEIAASAAAPHGPDGPLYHGTCRALPSEERDRRTAAEPHAWRLDVAKAAVEAGPLYWRDGDTEVQAEPEAHGDVVLTRKDAPVSYHLAVTVDDSAQGVTDVVAAATSTPRPTSTACSRPCSACRLRSTTTILCCSAPTAVASPSATGLRRCASFAKGEPTRRHWRPACSREKCRMDIRPGLPR